MNEKSGFFTVGRWNGVALRVHWTTPLAALCSAAPRGLHFSPGAWIAFALIILAHELGHAFLIRSSGAALSGIEATAVGGECHWDGNLNALQRATVAWGGMLGQASLFAASWIAIHALGPFHSATLADAIYVLTVTNGFIALVNLLPIAAFDGAEAWKFFALRRQARRYGRYQDGTNPLPPREWFEAPDEIPPLPHEVQEQVDRIIKDAGGRKQKVED
ncbi:MAG: hypothetical protein HY270_05380 [Deltaproteobacteria bacterium]|nr:hypothetical protein [Deltaproteobacteria bacterium]